MSHLISHFRNATCVKLSKVSIKLSSCVMLSVTKIRNKLYLSTNERQIPGNNRGKLNQQKVFPLQTFSNRCFACFWPTFNSADILLYYKLQIVHSFALYCAQQIQRLCSVTLPSVKRVWLHWAEWKGKSISPPTAWGGWDCSAMLSTKEAGHFSANHVTPPLVCFWQSYTWPNHIL